MASELPRIAATRRPGPRGRALACARLCALGRFALRRVGSRAVPSRQRSLSGRGISGIIEPFEEMLWRREGFGLVSKKGQRRSFAPRKRGLGRS